MKENYFSFCLVDAMTSKPIERGYYIFQNFNNEIEIITEFEDLIYIIFHYIANYNLYSLELFFRLAGFSAFSFGEIPESVVNCELIPLFEKKYVTIDLSNKVKFPIKSDEEAKKIAEEYIESILGEGVVSRYYEVQKAKFIESVQGLENIRTEENKEKIDEILKLCKSKYPKVFKKGNCH